MYYNKKRPVTGLKITKANKHINITKQFTKIKSIISPTT